MNINQLSEDVFATGQISPSDLDLLKEQGFKAIMCNRPDGEDEGQPEFTMIAKKANELGLNIRHVPYQGSQITPEILQHVKQAIDELPKPILAYCRSGGRVAKAYQMLKDAGEL